jgi:hypothetical protein
VRADSGSEMLEGGRAAGNGPYLKAFVEQSKCQRLPELIIIVDQEHLQ